MKFLYCLLAVCVAVNADPLPQSREQLENLVKLVLQNIKGAPESIENFISSTEPTVQSKLVKNKLVNKLEETLRDKLETTLETTGTIPEELLNCSISVITSFQKLTTEINNDLLQKLTTERYGKQGDYLNILKKDLSELQDALGNNAEQEIQSCLDGQSKCRLTEEFLPKSEEYFTFQDLMKPALASSVESLDEYFESEEVGHKIVVDLTHPAYECLNVTEQ